MTSNVGAKLMTGHDLAEMGDIGRCELVNGVIVMQGPAAWRHGLVEASIGSALGSFVDKHNLGRVMTGEVGLYTRRNPDTVRGADVMFISHARLARVTSRSFLDVAPELVVEVMSPDDRWTDVKRKLGEYFAVGVRVVWVADPDDNTVSVYRSLTDIQIAGAGETLDGGDALPGFSVAVAALFGAD